jgi:hypothetical protein
MLLIADTSPIISLLLIEKMEILEELFPDFLIPQAVWDELNNHQEIRIYQTQLNLLSQKVKNIVSLNGLWIFSQAVFINHLGSLYYLSFSNQWHRTG